MRLTAYLASRQGLQKWWPQGVDSGSTSTPLHRVHVNSRSARSCSEACAGGPNLILQASMGRVDIAAQSAKPFRNDLH